MNYRFSQKAFLAIFCLIMLAQPTLKAQDGFNPLGSESPLQLDGQRGYFIMTGTALASLFISMFSSHRTQNFAQLQAGFYNSGFDLSQDAQIVFQNVGLEKRLAPWFAIAAEANVQEIFRQNYATFGGGLMTYYRWYALGNKSLSPFFEYGGGVFGGVGKFPENGTRFTFRLTYKIGLEYTAENKNKFRLAFGHIHQSNNDLFDINPGYDGNGLTFSYAWSLD